MHKSPRYCRGFTLVELIISLTVLAIVTGLAIPSLQGMLLRNQANAALQSLSQAIHATRMLSIGHQRRALLCPSLDGRHCSGGTRWEQGWIVGIDRNHDGQPDATPLLIQAKLSGVLIRSSRGRTRIVYHPDGSAPGSNLSLRVCPTVRASATVDALIVSNAGRVRVTQVKATRCP